jgi:hypothetical protein
MLLLTQVAPFVSSFGSLIGQSWDVKALSREITVESIQKASKSGSTGIEATLKIVIEIVTVVSILTLVAQATHQSGVTKGTLIGIIVTTCAVLIPRFIVETTLSRYCDSCTPWGKFALGVMTLCVLVFISILLTSLILSNDS